MFPHHNSLEYSTVYSSSYYPAGALTGSSKASLDTRLIARCPVCAHPVAGSRFAAHLERCLSGGGRAKGLLSSSGSGSGACGLGLEVTTKRGKQVFQDPYPDSCIVRIRVNSTGPTLGQPKVFQEREGVSLQEWGREASARDRKKANK